MFWPTSIAKSPRIEPGAASSGLVAPITWRAASTAGSPSSTIATSGPEVMNVDQLAEERLAVVLGVVPLGQLGGHRHLLERREPQALALEAGDDLAGQVAREGVGLDEDQRALHGRQFSLRVSVAGRRSASPDGLLVGPPARRRPATGLLATPGHGAVARGEARRAIVPTSVSQNGQIFHVGSSGLPHALHGSLSLRRQFGQRRKSFSTS